MLLTEHQTIVPRRLIIRLQTVVSIRLESVSRVEEAADICICSILSIHHFDVISVKDTYTHFDLVSSARLDVPDRVMASSLGCRGVYFDPHAD